VVVSCSTRGANAAISWNTLAGAAAYAVRLNKSPLGDWNSPAAGDQFIAPVAQPSIYVSVSPDTYYEQALQGIKSGESYPYSGCQTSWAGFTCTGQHVGCTGASCGWIPGYNGGVDTCTPAGTTRTASWGSWGSCSVACGTGNEERTCNPGAENNCACSCSSPSVACGGTDSRSCCIDSSPLQPVVSSVTLYTAAGCTQRYDVDWTFPNNNNGCSQGWGYVCGTRTNQFRLLINGVEVKTGILYTARTDNTISLSAWSGTAQICASNGAAETCSTVYNYNLIAPTCGVSGQSPASGCYNNIPALSASYDTCSDQIQFGVDTDTGFGSPWSCNSGWLASANPVSYASCSVTGTGTYYWGARGRSTAAPIKCTTPAIPAPSRALSIDQTAPTPPGGEAFVSIYPDPDCRENYFASYKWNTTTDGGCGGLNALPYQSEVSTESDYSPLASGWSNSWVNTTQQALQQSYPGGTTFYGRVRARDSFTNTSGWTTTIYTIPTPSPYPTINIQGKYIEDLGTSCSTSMNIDPDQLDLQVTVPPGVTSTCTKTPSNYSCNLIVDNQGGDCIPPCFDMTLSATYGDYGNVDWRQSNQCGGEYLEIITICLLSPTPSPSITPGGPTLTPTPTNAPTSTPTLTPTPVGPTSTPTPTITPGGPTLTPTPTITPGGPTLTPIPTVTPGGPTLTPIPTGEVSPTSTPIPTATPLPPTPTPFGGSITPTPIVPPGVVPTIPVFFSVPSSWLKMGNVSYDNLRSGRSSIIPNNMLKYTDSDTDDTLDKYLIVNNAGGILSAGNLRLGPNATQYSEPNWYNTSYIQLHSFTPTKYAEYMKSRKEYKTITQLADIVGDGIYYVGSDIDINDSSYFVNKKIVLVADQNRIGINIDLNSASVGNAAIAIVARDITISSTVTEVQAILIGNNVTTGNTEDLALKIKGGLVHQSGTPTFENGRQLQNLQRPSLFIAMDQRQYLDLLPYLSISMYDWKQIQ